MTSLGDELPSVRALVVYNSNPAAIAPDQNKVRSGLRRAGVLRPGAHANEDQIRQFALANGPAYQYPRRVFFLKQLPLAGTNKIDRERLRQWAEEGTLHQQEPS